MICNVCGVNVDAAAEVAEVRSNVRKFAAEKFAVWRCPNCLSIHARDEVDLAYYYADYPFHKLKDMQSDWTLRASYGNLLARLKRAGLTKDARILDYGCGSGLFVRHARSQGYAETQGYDAYSEHFADPALLERQYDCVLAQDVIEHVLEPQAFVKQLHDLVRPGGIIAIGTPNAEDINLKNPEPRVHALHQPYHRNILSKRALQGLGKELGWQLLRYYPNMYVNTLYPAVNAAFIGRYFASFDNNCDLAVEPLRMNSWKLWSPVMFVYALLGYFWAPESDVMVVFRRT